jgi:hypothetical protein
MRVRRALRAFGTILPSLLADTAGLTGAGLVSWGVWQIYAPAGYIAGGVLLLAGAALFSRAAPEPPPPAEE